jgi:hypothetical protein
MLKSQTLDLILPTNDDVNKDEETMIKQSDAITFIIDGEVSKDNLGNPVVNKGAIYYYLAQPDLENYTLDKIEFGNSKEAIRGMLQDRNKELLKKVNEYKKEWKEGKINDSIYNDKVRKARIAQAEDINAHRPIVSIKPTANASYADVVKLLDEMQISQIATYQIETLSKEDTLLYENKVGPLRTTK